MFKTLAFVRGEIRVISVEFENDVPIAIMDNGSRMPLDATYLHHVAQVDAQYWYQLEVLPP